MRKKPLHESEQVKIEKLVREFRSYNLPDLETEKNFFKDMPSLEVCIHHAALAIDHRGKRYKHQCRLQLVVLRKAEECLSSVFSRLKESKTFHDLFLIVREQTSLINGIGELFIYDTALRIGAYLGLAPDRVYLHAGTTTGIRALGLDSHQEWIDISKLPSALRSLSPNEIESFLCVFKDKLVNAKY
ncbi:hypothetical protein ACO0LG_04645 [Undibacterium sp. Ji42W]|uniref:hypothetical protein n=1 Tax=Undibacterium sp. Ji42W TaxID=3413039 RepID=UPI003BF381FF